MYTPMICYKPLKYFIISQHWWVVIELTCTTVVVMRIYDKWCISICYYLNIHFSFILFPSFITPILSPISCTTYSHLHVVCPYSLILTVFILLWIEQHWRRTGIEHKTSVHSIHTRLHTGASQKNEKKLARSFTLKFCYIDDVISLNISRFGDIVDRIYPIELEIKDTTDTDRSASYFDLYFKLDSEGWLRTKLYDKREDFNFPTFHLYVATFQQHLHISLSWYDIPDTSGILW